MLTAPPSRRAPLVAALVVALAAAGFLAWSVVGLFSSGADRDRAAEELASANDRLRDLRADGAIQVEVARDGALEAARTGVATLNTLDYRTIDADLDRWEEVTTGALHDEITGGRADSREAVVAARSVTEAEVLSAAVKAVDEQAGTATVLVAVRVEVTLAGGEPTDRYLRMQSTLRRTDQGWKVDGVGQVPYLS